MAIRSVVTRGYGNGTFNGTIGGVVLRGYISSTDSIGSKTTTLDGLTLTATGSVEVTGSKTTTLGLTLTASGSVAIVGSKTTTLADVLLTANGINAPDIAGAYNNILSGFTLTATGSISDASGWSKQSDATVSWSVQADSSGSWSVQ